MTDRSTAGYIGPGLVVRGRLSGEGALHIDGRFEGTMEVQGNVEIGADGVVESPVGAGRVTIAGSVRGNVDASEAVVIQMGGRVEGDVYAKRVAIDDGGALHGSIHMDFDLPRGDVDREQES